MITKGRFQSSSGDEIDSCMFIKKKKAGVKNKEKKGSNNESQISGCDMEENAVIFWLFLYRKRNRAGMKSD